MCFKICVCDCAWVEIVIIFLSILASNPAHFIIMSDDDGGYSKSYVKNLVRKGMNEMREASAKARADRVPDEGAQVAVPGIVMVEEQRMEWEDDIIIEEREEEVQEDEEEDEEEDEGEDEGEDPTSSPSSQQREDYLDDLRRWALDANIPAVHLTTLLKINAKVVPFHIPKTAATLLKVLSTQFHPLGKILM